MQPTSSETSAKRSSGFSRAALAAWLGVATLLVALGFIGTSTAQSDPSVLYDYSFAAGSVLIYAILVAVSLAIARALGRPLAAAGLTKFSWSWTWKALGLIVLVLVLAQILEPVFHAGEKQGLEPDVWRPDRATAFALNAMVASTVVPFAEELFFRGVGVRALLPFGGLGAVSVTALAFGLGHGILAALPVLVLFGAALGWVRLRSDSAWPGMIAHGFFNGIALVLVYVSLT
jgi:membrane protease YdiL (CAAX protease family)